MAGALTFDDLIPAGKKAGAALDFSDLIPATIPGSRVAPVAATMKPADVKPGAGWTDPETGETFKIVAPTGNRKPGEMTPADIESRKRVLASQKPRDIPRASFAEQKLTPFDPAASVKAANDPAFTREALAAVPDASKPEALRIMGGQRGQLRGPMETFGREAINTAGMGLPRLGMAYLSGEPVAAEHEMMKAADDRGAALNPKSAVAGALAGIGGQVLATPAAAVATPARAAITGALTAAIPTAADTRGDPVSVSRDAVLGALMGGGLAKGAGIPSKHAVRTAAPSLDDIEAAGKAAYQKADALGVQFAQPSFAAFGQRAAQKAVNEGFDPVLHPKANRVMEILADRGANAPGLSDVEAMRRIMQRAGSQVPEEQRLLSRMVSQLDDYVARAGPADMVSGDPAKAAQVLGEARGNWAAKAKAEKVNEALERARRAHQGSGSGANEDNAIRQAIKSLVQNKRQMRGFTGEEREALESVVSGTTTQNLARLIGKMSPTHPLIASLTGGAAYAAAGPYGLAAPVIGHGAKMYADRATRKNAEIAEALIRSGAPAAAGGKGKPSPPQPHQLRALIAALLVSGQSAQLPVLTPAQ